MKNKHIVIAFILCTLCPFAVGFWAGFTNLPDVETYKLFESSPILVLDVLGLALAAWMAVKVWRTPDQKNIF